MLAKRVIPCLDVDRGRVVKGTNFVNLRDAGDPKRAIGVRASDQPRLVERDFRALDRLLRRVLEHETAKHGGTTGGGLCTRRRDR